MAGKNAQQGEIIIDHRNSPGITPEFMAANNLEGPCVAGGTTFSSGLKNCAHCGADVIMHPQRTRERQWCWVCDAYICDGCGLLKKLGASHRPLRAIIEEVFNAISRRF